MIKSFINYIIFLVSLLTGAAAALIWLPTGSTIVLPAARYIGGNMTPSVKIAGIEGSVWQGYSVSGLEIVSGDKTYLTLDHAAAIPDWNLIMSGRPWLKSIEISGLNADTDRIRELVELFGSEDNEDTAAPLSIEFMPIRISVKDVNISSPEADINISSFTFDENGHMSVRAGANGIPLEADARIAMEPLSIVSSDVRFGAGKASLKGRLEAPFDFRCDITALPIENLIENITAFVPDIAIRAKGRFDGRVLLKSESDISDLSDIKASGVLSLQRGIIEGFPLNLRVPWSWDGKAFSVSGGNISTNAAEAEFRALADLSGGTNTAILTASGSLKNISLREIGRIAAPDAGLSGEGGRVDFDIEVPLNSISNIEKIKGTFKADIPEVTAAKMNLIKGLNANIRLAPGKAPQISANGSVFGGRLSASAVANGLTSGKLSPSAEILLSNIDLASLASAVPGLKGVKPSGKITLKAHVDKDLSVTGEIKSGRLSAAGASIRDFTADINFDYRHMTAGAKLAFQKGSVSGFPIDRLGMSIGYAKNQLSLSDAHVGLPGGSVKMRGTVGLSNPSDPNLDIEVDAETLNLAHLSRAMKLKQPVTGIVKGKASVKGALSTAAVNASLSAEDIKTGDIHIPTASLTAGGRMDRVNVDKLHAVVRTPGSADAFIRGKGSIALNNKNIMNSTLNIGVGIAGLELRPLLTRFAGSAPVGGSLAGYLKMNGTLAKPNLDLKIFSPLSVSNYVIDHISLKLNSPAKEHYVLSGSAMIGDFLFAADCDVRNQKNGWEYTLTTKPIDISSLLSVTSPQTKDMARGQATVRVNGALKDNVPIGVRVSVPKLTLIDKITIEDITLPVTVSLKDNRVKVREAQAMLCDGIIRSKVDVNLSDSTWNCNVSVKRLNIGQLAGPFMPEGEIVGTAEANIEAKGSFGIFPQTFASGSFATGSGYIHKIALLDRVTPTKRVSFEKVRGTFFWNGVDLFLNPGCQATAGPDEPLYRYVSINGSLGIPGKGLKLICDGRFDLKILDRLLGTMRGIFQYMSGSLTGSGSFLRDAVGRMVGIKKRDYQNVSFTLANSWQELRMLDLKITKPIQDFLPIDQLNKKEEQQKEDKQFRLSLKFPTGHGSTSDDGMSTSDQFKEQLIDNLFRLGE